MDWNLDGKLDILTGCYWTDGADAGQIQILEGKGDLDFEEATSLLSVADKPLENVELAEDAGPTGMDPNQTKNICTQQHAVDWDGDGDLDMVVGCFGNNFFLYENEGSDMENRLVEKPIELELTSPDHHAAPHLVDFDGDGDLDFLTGGASGGAYIAINEGTRKEPKYGDFMSLLDKPESAYEPQRSDTLTVGGGTRLWATDYNGDGLMDLIVGDNVTISQPVEGVSKEDFAKKKAESKKKMARLMTRYQELAESGREMDDEMNEKFGNMMRDFSESSSEYEESRMTGHVWVFLQKPKTESDKEVSLK